MMGRRRGSRSYDITPVINSLRLGLRSKTSPCATTTPSNMARVIAASLQSSWRHARDLEREGVGKRHLLETVEAPRGPGVAGVEVGAKGNQIVIRAQAPQPRDPLRRLPIEHARIGQ